MICKNEVYKFGNYNQDEYSISIRFTLYNEQWILCKKIHGYSKNDYRFFRLSDNNSYWVQDEYGTRPLYLKLKEHIFQNYKELYNNIDWVTGKDKRSASS